jgi:hypothetical protein
MRARQLIPTLTALTGLALVPAPAAAFCGFYVAKADTKLFNQASKVVIARDGQRTVITMVSDYRGEARDFAMVVPVPTVLAREQVHVTDSAVVEHLDAYTAPRLVEYFDPDPCRPRVLHKSARSDAKAPQATRPAQQAAALGVTIEARYTVGEYDILILSAEESSGLQRWLVGNGYRLPDGVVPVLEDYIARGMKFFVARVNLGEKAKLGTRFLRPLQIAFESANFMLPIRLGMVNAGGPQELFILTLTRQGRVETRNYRTVPMPSNLDLPIFVKEEFPDFYRDMFARQAAKEGGRAVFLEYAWDMAWCDPCAADPLSVAELRELGAFWVADRGTRRGLKAMARDVFVTRLHLRYDDAHFAEDLMLRETANRANFQGRYVLRHPWTGPARYAAGRAYRVELPRRFEREARQLAALTAWPITDIRQRMETSGQSFRQPYDPETEWWRRLWPDG